MPDSLLPQPKAVSSQDRTRASREEKAAWESQETRRREGRADLREGRASRNPQGRADHPQTRRNRKQLEQARLDQASLDRTQTQIPVQTEPVPPAPAAPQKSSRTPYLPALDGLRTLAVVAVIIYHLKPNWLPSGLMGVTVFFVLSGYLITGLLISEFNDSGTINLKAFWMRRVRRLVPAIILVIGVTTVLVAIFNPYLLTKIQQDLCPSLFFYSNWSYILRDLSYFEAMDAPSPLTHFWSLSVEEQFYIVWPVLLLILFKCRVPKKILRGGIIVLVIASALEMALLFSPDADPTRVYYGTDTRAFSLLIGAYLAFRFPAWRFMGEGRQGELSPSAMRLIDVASVPALIVLILLMVLLRQSSPFLYRGGLLLASLCTGLVLLSLVHAGSALNRIFATRPMVWAGKRSYGIYLWHYPLFLLMNPVNSTLKVPLAVMLIEVIVVFIVAALSYHFVENPIRHGCLGKLVKDVRAGEVQFGSYLAKHAVYIIGTIALVLAAAFFLAAPPAEALVQPKLMNQLKRSLDFEGVNEAASGSDKSATHHKKKSGKLGPVEQACEEMLEQFEALSTPLTHEEALEKVADMDVLFVGDSVPLGAEAQFAADFKAGMLDAEFNRSVYSFPGIYQAYVDGGWDGDAVIMSLGTVDEIDADRFYAAADAVPGDRPLFIVTLRNHFDTSEGINEILYAIESDHSNVHLIDWYGNTIGKDELITYDGVHLSDEGCEEYMNLVVDTVAETMRKLSYQQS